MTYTTRWSWRGGRAKDARVAEAEYDAWLVDLDGTLYSARWVKLLHGAELALFGWSALKTLRQFRHEHEALRA